jgi:hypothetical protein
MKGKLLLAILLLAPLCCVVETTAEDDDDEPSCNETGCIELGLCNYTDECRCPSTVAHCQNTAGCQEHGGMCCLGLSDIDGCPQCQTSPLGPWGACP